MMLTKSNREIDEIFSRRASEAMMSAAAAEHAAQLHSKPHLSRRSVFRCACGRRGLKMPFSGLIFLETFEAEILF